MLNKITLKQRLLIILLIFSSLPTFILAGSLYAKLYDIRENDKKNIIYDSINNNADGFNDWIKTKINLIESTEFLISVLNADSDLKMDDLVDKINSQSLNVEELYVFKKESRMSLSENSNLEWYLRASRNNKFIISEIHENQFGNDVISFAQDINFRNSNYVISIDISVIELKKELSKLYYSNGLGVGILFNGKILYLDAEIANIPLEKVIFNDTSAIVLNYNGLKIIGVNSKIENEIRLVVIEKFVDNLHDVNEMRKDFIKIMLLVFLVSIILSLYLSSRLINPIENIKKGLENAIARKSNIGVLGGSDYEYLQLYELYKDMILKDQKLDYRKIEINQKTDQLSREFDRSIIELEKVVDSLKNIEVYIKHSNKKFNNLFNNIKDFIWTIDIDGNIESANNVFIEKLGYERDEILASSFKDIIIQKGKNVNAEDFMFELLRKDQVNITLYLKKKMFSEYELVVFNSKRIVDNGKLLGTQFVARRIIDKEILEKKMYKRNKELEFIKDISRTLTNSKNLEELLTSIAHKIKNLIEKGVCSIWLLDVNGKLELKASSDSELNIDEVDFVNVEEDMLGEAILKNKVVKINSYDKLNNKSYDSMKGSVEHLKEMIFIPLENSGTPSGLISIAAGNNLSELDIDILSAFASQSSVAIEKAKLYEKLKLDYFNTIKVLATAVEAKDAYTEGHSIRVSKFAVLIGKKLKMNELEIEELEIAGILHDIGKIGVDDTILTKPGLLSDDEYMEIRKHPEVGARIIEPIELSESIVEGVLYHHITYDGKGYPTTDNINIKTKIPYIIGVADALDAMTSNRLYSQKKTITEAIDELVRFKGTQFSPEIVDVVIEIYKSGSEKLDEISDFETIK
ncbi:MAG: HD domain-containing phosphohydrolase [Acidaminobacteraceae bacterium]